MSENSDSHKEKESQNSEKDDKNDKNEPENGNELQSELQSEAAAAKGSVDDDRSDEDDDSDDVSMMEKLRYFFMKNLNLKVEESAPSEVVLKELNFNGIIEYMKSDNCKNVIVMVGAGISTSAGIPDFRSPESGIYSKIALKLAKYKLPSPECMFDINFFRENPYPFYCLAKELFPGQFKPTLCHYFVRLLHEKNYLLRLYTQNVDTLERIAGIPDEKIVEAHGTFHTSHCLNSSCRTEYSLEWMRDHIFNDEIPTCDKCQSSVKPDIVFFGERLPHRFFQLSKEDFAKCDLLIIIGTSLKVQPFAGLIDNVPSKTPRLLINRTAAGNETSQMARLLGIGSGLLFESDDNYRDVFWLGDCDDGCGEFAESMGWKSQLMRMMEEEHKRIDQEK